MIRLIAINIGVLLVFCTSAGNIPASKKNRYTPELIHIPAGNFIQGSDTIEREYGYQLDEASYGHSRTRQGGWYDSEIYRKSVFTAKFPITKNLITNLQYALFVEDTGHRVPSVHEKTWRSYGLVHPYASTVKFSWKTKTFKEGRALHPVVLISQTDAIAYALWLSTKTGIEWTLPSEIQWEKAARGTDGRYFPWGNKYFPDHLNSHDAGPFDTQPVGSFPSGKSPYGMMDAAGQVFEWTHDLLSKQHALVKGGSWDDKGCGVCRAAARHSRPKYLKHILIGFRLVTKQSE